jgi:mono/diheme cytochrome c family protein
MTPRKLAFLVFGLALVLFLLLPGLSWADDAAGLYKAKCSACHTVDGAGKPAAKIPSLISPEAKSRSVAELTDAIANGGKEQKPMHTFSKKGLTPEQVKALVAYIRTLQK